VSRKGKLPVTIPAGVQVKQDGTSVSVKGPKGSLTRTFSSEISIKLEDAALLVTRPNDEPRIRALHGTTRALLANMVAGVSQGFTKQLLIEGVGYRAEVQGKDLVLYLGYSHPVTVKPPEGISFETDPKTRSVTISGPDREQVGQVAADVRKLRPPEPYKGKGIRYTGEVVRRKAGKAGKVG
jgi:large subunit ribosomal protein L6